MDDKNAKLKSDLEGKKRDLEHKKSSNDSQLRQLYRTLEGGKPLNGSEEYTKKRLEKENEDSDKKIADIDKAIDQLD